MASTQPNRNCNELNYSMWTLIHGKLEQWGCCLQSCETVVGLECSQVHVHDGRNPALDWSLWLVWFSLVCSASVCPHPETTLLCTFPAMWILTFLKSTFLFGEDFQLFTLHWQKRSWEWDTIWCQEFICSEFCVIFQWFFLTSYVYKCFIFMNWEQHCHLFPLFLIYIDFLVTDDNGVRLKLTFHIATFCGTGS